MGAATWKNSLAIPQKAKLSYPDDPAVLLVGVHPREMKTFLHRNLHMNVCGRLLDNKQKRYNPNVCQLMNE